MEKIIHIPVEYGGAEREFEAKVQFWQYGSRFLLSVDGVEMVFERDDSGDYRAIVTEGYSGKLPDRGLIEAIAKVLDGL